MKNVLFSLALMVAVIPGKMFIYAPELLPTSLIIPGAVEVMLEGGALVVFGILWRNHESWQDSERSESENR